MIEKGHTDNYCELINIWESAVSATHGFLSESDYKSILSQLTSYFDNVDLFIYKMDNSAVGFIGIAGDKVEMLFVHNQYRGKGIGGKLLRFAIDELHIRYVDVNEQNKPAILFYEKSGFYGFDRSESDGEGRRYPIIKMKLKDILLC